MTFERSSDQPLSGSRGWLVAFALVLLAAAALRLVGLGDIDQPYFDETYYVAQARERLESLEPQDRPAHPPLGTWMIAGGIAVVGDEPLGWRIVPALSGVATVGLAYLLAVDVWRRRAVGVLAAALVALDALGLVVSRVAILDGLQAPLALVALLTALRWARHRRTGWLLATGVALGAITSIKWNGALLLLAVAGWMALVTLAGDGRRWHRPVRAVAIGAAVAAIAATTYVATYASWFVDYEDTETAAQRCEELGACGTGAVDRARSWVWEQRERADYHDRLPATHPDRATPLEWVALSDPVTIYRARCVDGSPGCSAAPPTRRILVTGNPALWWPALAAIPVVGAVAVRRRRADLALVAAAPLALWLPWFASPKPGFQYFLTPFAPLLAVALASGLCSLPSRRRQAVTSAVVVVAVLAVAAWHAPLYFGWGLDEAAIARRNLFPSWPE